MAEFDELLERAKDRLDADNARAAAKQEQARIARRGTGDRTYVPIGDIEQVPAARFVMIRARPQIPFRGDRLCVWSRCAPSFLIHSIHVGTQVMGATSGTIPADAFASKLDLLQAVELQLEGDVIRIDVSELALDAIGMPLTLPLTRPGMEIIMNVQNIDDVPMRFVGAFFGNIER